ncbi:MAG: AAA family ATPase [Kiritimatiellae bacterium]|nr:AAA family ATPase [Kiritimatiellia bacterium]
MKAKISKNVTGREIERYREEFAKLPIGSISRKTIAGKVRYYRQWVEDGRTRSEYLKESEVDGVRRQIERRRELAKILRAWGVGKRSSSMRDPAVKTGRELSDWADFVSGWDFRDVFPDILKFLRWPAESKVLIVFGIRRTGKTTMLQQAVRALTREEFAKAAYIKVRTGDTLETMDDRLSRLHRRGFRYVFIDEVTLLDDFIDGASLFSDVYAPMGMKTVLSGTDSLGFRMSID